MLMLRFRAKRIGDTDFEKRGIESAVVNGVAVVVANTPPPVTLAARNRNVYILLLTRLERVWPTVVASLFSIFVQAVKLPLDPSR